MVTEKISILRSFLGGYRKSSDEYLFKCPACNHHKNKLSVNIELDKFKCWICDYSGNTVYRLVRRYGKYENKKKWQEFDTRVDFSKIDFKDSLFVEKEEETETQRLNLPKEFKTLTSCSSKATHKLAKKYLYSRGLTDSDILKWKIGYCDHGEYSGRIIVPSFDDEGYVNYFIARTYTGDFMKYKNPPTSRDMIFNELYVDWKNDLVIVEGVFDAIVAENAVPILGSTLRENSSLFERICKEDSPVYIALDPDAEKKSLTLINNLLSYDVEIFKIDVSGYDDIGSMTRDTFVSRKQKATLMNNSNSIYYSLNFI